jgi:hypothetical protein
MYLVDHKTFNEFVIKNGLDKNEPPIVEATPFILEYKRNGIMMAKIEMVNIPEFKYLKKYQKIQGAEKNKYWIRGNEWEVRDGSPIMKLTI